MDNLFLTQLFDWDQPPPRRRRWLNGLFRRLGSEARIVSPYQTGEMTTIEQRINMFHLVSQVLTYRVAGDLVEIGTNRGYSAALFAKVIAEQAPDRSLHVYDAFENPTEEVMLQHFEALQLAPPVIHKGWLAQTMNRIPERISFFHLDLGPGRSPEGMREDIAYCLERLYPRMSPGAVGLLMDYCDAHAYEREGFHFPHCILSNRVWNPYPFIKDVCDEFFADKSEKVYPLYGGSYSHGYFRKLG